MAEPLTDPGIIFELTDESAYGGYLCLDRILSAQQPRSSHHDELLFIIQSSEVW